MIRLPLRLVPFVILAGRLLGQVAAGSAPAAMHRFETYAVHDSLGGKPARVDLSSAAGAREFRTVLREGAAAGPNFAGHFTVVTWGCGSSCQQTAVIDARTGRVWLAPWFTEVGSQYRRSSALFIAGVPADWYEAWETDPLPDRAFTYYYRWTGRRLVLLDSGRVPARRR